MNNDKITTYPGAEIDVFWDERLCIHQGECGKAKGGLFLSGRQPWCVPDALGRTEVKEVVERCPSGALTYRDRSGAGEEAPPTNQIAVTYNGPLFVSGQLAIEGAPEGMPGVAFRAALCRCGHSKNKPFCDNSHETIGFRDPGAVGERGTPLAYPRGQLTIRPLKDGPLLIAGPVTIRASSGRLAWQGTQTALCRCGESKNKPFCDGSHKASGFTTEA